MMSLAKSLFRSDTRPPPADAAKRGQFRAKSTEDLQTVTIKLAAVEAEIATAESELSKVSLAAVLADDQTTGFQAVSSLNELRARRELLRHALSAAQLAENERLASLRSKADKARDNALKQHSATLERQVVTLTTAQLAVRDAFRALVETADKVAKNLPKSLRNGFETQLTADSLRFLAEVAAYGMSQDAVRAPGCSKPPAGHHTIDNWTGHYPGLTVMVGDRVLAPIRHYLNPPAPAIPEIASVTPTEADAPAVTGASSSSSGLAAQDELPKGGEPGNPLGSSPSTATRSPALTGVSISSRGIEDRTTPEPVPEPFQEVAEAMEGEASEAY
jgi:hypothetical protein